MKFFKSLSLYLWAAAALVGSFPANAQMSTTELLIPYYSQQTNNWCWAASIKMVLDFHNPNNSTPVDQCRLAKDLYKLTTKYTSHAAIEAINCCTTCSLGCPDGTSDCANGSPNDLANRTVPYTYDSPLPKAASPDHYDLLFSSYGYSSIQQVNHTGDPMEWAHIKKQIKDDCRPFIINVADAPSDDLSGNHALVVKGYREDPTLNLKLVLTNDPWKPCCTGMQEAILPYDNFTETTMTGFGVNSNFISNVQSTIHTIQPGTIFDGVDESDCISCEFLDPIYPGKSYIRETNEGDQLDAATGGRPARREGKAEVKLVAQEYHVKGSPLTENEPSKLLAVLDEHKEQIIGYPQTSFKEGTFEERIDQVGYFYAPVQYISSRLLNRSYFLACLFPPKKLYKVSIPEVEVVEIRNGNVEETVASSFQKTPDGLWKLRKITTYSFLENDIPVKLNKGEATFTLNNRKGAADAEEKTDFRLIKYYPFQYEFFSFTYNGKEYLAPAGDYDKQLGLSKNVAYKEGFALRSLRRNTRDFEKFVKSELLGNQDYSAILKGLLQLIPTQKPIYDGINVVNPEKKVSK